MSKIVKTTGQIDRQLNKPEIINLAKEHSSEIMKSDKYDLLKVYIEFKRYEIYLKTLIEEVKKETFRQAIEEGRRDFGYGSARVSIEKRRKYDFSADVDWQSIQKEIESLKLLKKECERMLKNIKGDYKEILDEETGEIFKIEAPKIEYSENLRVGL